MSLISDLKRVGLSEKSAKIYLAILELGQGSVQEIANKAGVKRSTVYVILEELIKTGLCSTVDIGNKTFYTASDPEAIQNIIEIQKKELEEKLGYFEKIKEDLNLIKNKTSKNKPVVSFYEGKNGLENSSAEMNKGGLSIGKEVQSIYPLDRMLDALEDPQFVIRRNKNVANRIKLGIKARVICNSKRVKEYQDDFDKYIVLDANKYLIDSDINIVGNLIRITTWDDEGSAIIIRKKEVAQTLKTLFELAWLGAQTLNKDKK